MAGKVLSNALPLLFLSLFPPSVSSARSCAQRTHSIRVGDLRYDGPDPLKRTNTSTIGLSLLGEALLPTGPSPLYECFVEWPEPWKGWYRGEKELVWADCIFTGAGAGGDERVSFAVDWKEKKVWLGHLFECSDMEGYVPLSFSRPSRHWQDADTITP